jgi:hypothetical protein
MGTLILILIALPLAVGILGFFIPIIAKIFIHLDYGFLLILVWGFVFGASGYNPDGLLANHELHTVFVILIYLAALAIWFGLQQIRVIKIYIFRIFACALSAFIFTYLVSTGLFGRAIADGMDIIWQWAVGIVYFGIAIMLRVRDESLT